MPHRSKIHGQENRQERKANALVARRKKYEAVRGGTPRQRGYDAQWERDRTAYLAAHPLCADCLRQGRVTPATVLDHVIPHRGDHALFINSRNRQGLCVSCHGAKTVRESAPAACSDPTSPLRTSIASLIHSNLQPNP